MSGRLTARGVAYLAAATVAPFASLAFGDPGPVLVVLPVVIVLAVVLRRGQPSAPAVQVTTEAERALEGGRLSLTVHVEDAAGPRAHVLLGLPGHTSVMSVVGGTQAGLNGVVVPLRRGLGEAVIEVVPGRWGVLNLGGWAEVPGPFGLTTSRAGAQGGSVAIFPDPESTRRLLAPLLTSLHAGDLVSVARGAGSEPAGLRQWDPTDPPRMINWRASARSEELWVTERHADRGGDLVLVVDPITDRGDVADATGRVVTLVAGLVAAHGRSRHRLGLVTLSGFVRWFGLGSGAVHEYRLLEALVRTQAVVEPVWMAVDRILARAVHRPALVVFVTPLAAEGMVDRIMELARRGMDTAVVAVDSSDRIPDGDTRLRRVARSLGRLERQRTVDMLRSAGVAVGEWRRERSLDEVIEEMERWRLSRRRVPI